MRSVRIGPVPGRTFPETFQFPPVIPAPRVGSLWNVTTRSSKVKSPWNPTNLFCVSIVVVVTGTVKLRNKCVDDFWQRHRGSNSHRCSHPHLPPVVRAFRTIDKPRNNIAIDQRVVILSGLATSNPGIRAACRSEPELSYIGDPGRDAKVESLNGNDIHRSDHVVAIHVSGIPSASWWERIDIEVMLLCGEQIHGVDAWSARRPGVESA